MIRFLRYNGRHCLWFPRGYSGEWLPKLNPILMSSHGANGRETFCLFEPMWMFCIRQAWFSFAGRQRCDRRMYVSHDNPYPDTWDIGPDGNRTCSYCGSIHPDDFMKICQLTLTDDRYAVEPTDKKHKVYVRIPGVRNAGDGAIKFYMDHAHENPTDEQHKLFSDAVRLSNERFSRKMRGSWPDNRSSTP